MMKEPTQIYQKEAFLLNSSELPQINYKLNIYTCDSLLCACYLRIFVCLHSRMKSFFYYYSISRSLSVQIFWCLMEPLCPISMYLSVLIVV